MNTCVKVPKKWVLQLEGVLQLGEYGNYGECCKPIYLP